MFEKIEKLKNNGYTPEVILDIGAHKGIWTKNVLKIYSKTKYYLFEANNNTNLVHKNVKVFNNVVLNDKKEEIDWYTTNNKSTGDSMFLEKTHHYKNCIIQKRTTTTLDALLSENNLHNLNNIFIKIDCQGAEIPILKGATNVLNKTDFIVLELPFFGEYNANVPSFLEHIKFMDDIGFIPYDILDIHNIVNFTVQTDILFINKNHNFNNIVQNRLMSP